MENERWVAMDITGYVFCHLNKPTKDEYGLFHVGIKGGTIISDSSVLFPDLTHENSPMKIKLEV